MTRYRSALAVVGKLSIAAALLISCTSLSTSWITSADPKSVDRRPADYAMGSELTDDLDFKTMIQLFLQQNISTVESALAILSARYPQYFSRYALAYDSSSIQKSTFQSPRAIVFGKSGRFILSFGGDPKLDGFGSIETLSWNEQARDFEFREVNFLAQSPKDLGLSSDEIDLANSNNQIVTSKTNVSKCTACHGDKEVHAIWDTYPLWPGLYGSDADNLNNEYYNRHLIDARNQITTGPEDRERTEFLKFMQGPRNTDARYKTLQPLRIDFGNGPNTDLGVYLTNMQMRKIGRIIVENPKLRPFRYAVLGYARCGGLHSNFQEEALSWLPDNILRRYPGLQSGFRNAFDKTMQSRQFYGQNKMNLDIEQRGLQALNVNPRFPLIADDTDEVGPYQMNVPALSNLMENLGQDISLWTLPKAINPYTFSSGVLLHETLAQEILKGESDQELLSSYHQLDEKACPILKKKSLGELSKLL